MSSDETPKICFVIAPIGERGSDVWKRSDQVLRHIIKPAAEECGYQAIRADEISAPGLITSQVLDHVKDDHVVIADLTGHNPNVFYELAVRHAVHKPVIQVIEKGDRLPFDVAGMRTITVDHRDLDSAEECRKDVVNAIKSIEAGDFEVVSPVSVAVDLQNLRQSDNPVEGRLAEILDKLSQLSSEVAGMRGGTYTFPLSTTPPSGSKVYFTGTVPSSLESSFADFLKAAPSPTTFVIRSEYKTCQSCGRWNTPSAIMCANCGAALPAS